MTQLNLMPTTHNAGNITPHEFYTGVRPSFPSHYKFSAMQLVEVHTGKNSKKIDGKQLVYNSKGYNRTEPCLALQPLGTASNSYSLFNLRTGKRVVSHIAYPRAYDDEILQLFSKLEAVSTTVSAPTELHDMSAELPLDSETGVPATITSQHVDDSDEVPPLINDDSDDEDDDDDRPPYRRPQGVHFAPTKEDLELAERPTAARLQELNDAQVQPINLKEIFSTTVPSTAPLSISTAAAPYVLQMTSKEATTRMGSDRKGDCTKTEALNLFVDNDALLPRKASTVPQSFKQKPLWMHVIYDEKFNPDGSFDKDKARGVVGETKDRCTAEVTNTYTPHQSSLHLNAAIAHSEKRHVRTWDVKAAFLKAKVKRELYVRAPKDLVDSLLQIDEKKFRPFVLKDGTMWAKVNKAVYGTGDAARLWYMLVKKTLLDNGFVMNPYDRCVFNKIFKGFQITLSVHIDDFKGSCKLEDGLDYVYDILQKNFQTVKQTTGKIIHYLGMVYDYTNESYVAVTAPNFLNGVVSFYNVTEFADFPAESTLRILDENSPRLAGSTAEKFHSLAYKLLYLAKRCRPDLLPAAQFFTTRVSISTEQDMGKAFHTLKYINHTRTLELRLSATQPLAILCYIDSAHAVHPNKKSQSGSCIGLGVGSVHWATAGIKMNTKSSAESEFYGMGEHVTDAIFIRNYLLAQGYNFPPATVYQDNQAAIRLSENGVASSSRTRHIDIRYFFIQDRIENGEQVLTLEFHNYLK